MEVTNKIDFIKIWMRTWNVNRMAKKHLKHLPLITKKILICEAYASLWFIIFPKKLLGPTTCNSGLRQTSPYTYLFLKPVLALYTDFLKCKADLTSKAQIWTKRWTEIA